MTDRFLQHPLPAVAASSLITGIAYGVAFPDRPDYLGHYLAGFGATLALLFLLFALPQKRRPEGVVVATLVAVALGWGIEGTIFKLAIFDPVDFFNQSLGAVVAAAAVLGSRERRATRLWFLGLGLTLLIAGFYFAFS